MFYSLLASLGLGIAWNQASSDASYYRWRYIDAESEYDAQSTEIARMNIASKYLIPSPQFVQVYAPQSEALEHNDDDFVSVYCSGVSENNFAVLVKFKNPYAASTNSWDYGLMFRHSGGNQQYRLALHSNAWWDLTLRDGDNSVDIESGNLDVINVNAGQVNAVYLIVKNRDGFLFINDQFIADFDLIAKSGSGDICVATGIYNRNEVNGKETGFVDFTIWSLP